MKSWWYQWKNTWKETGRLPSLCTSHSASSPFLSIEIKLTLQNTARSSFLQETFPGGILEILCCLCDSYNFIFISHLADRTCTWYFSYLHAIIPCHRMLTFSRTGLCLFSLTTIDLILIPKIIPINPTMEWCSLRRQDMAKLLGSSTRLYLSGLNWVHLTKNVRPLPPYQAARWLLLFHTPIPTSNPTHNTKRYILWANWTMEMPDSGILRVV